MPSRRIVPSVALLGLLALTGCAGVGDVSSCDGVVTTVQNAMAAAPDPAQALRDGDYAAVAEASTALAAGIGSAADATGDLVLKAGLSGLRVGVEQLGPLIEQFGSSGNADQVADLVDEYLTPEAIEAGIRAVCPA